MHCMEGNDGIHRGEDVKTLAFVHFLVKLVLDFFGFICYYMQALRRGPRGAQKKLKKNRKKFLTSSKSCDTITWLNRRAQVRNEKATVPCKLNNTNEPRNTLDNLNGLFKRFFKDEFINSQRKFLSNIC